MKLLQSIWFGGSSLQLDGHPAPDWLQASFKQILKPPLVLLLELVNFLLPVQASNFTLLYQSELLKQMLLNLLVIWSAPHLHDCFLQTAVLNRNLLKNNTVWLRMLTAMDSSLMKDTNQKWHALFVIELVILEQVYSW